MKRGFTLLEVMVAMAILATVLVVLLQNHGMSIRMSQRARDASVAANLARDLMTEAELEDRRRQLRERFADLGEMTAGVAHQMKNGLAEFQGVRHPY